MSHPEIAEVNFDGRPSQRGGLARRALSRAHEAKRKAANEDGAREAKRSEVKQSKGERRAKEISELSVVFKGMERQDGRCG